MQRRRVRVEELMGGWLLPRSTGSGRRVVCLGGDGIGPEVTSAAIRALRATGAPLELIEPLHGEAAIREGKPAFPEEVRTLCLGADATLYGASGGTSGPILRFLRFELNTYANLRPSATLPGVPARTGTEGTNLVLVRELTEGMYPGREGNLSEFNARWPEFRDRLGRALPAEGKFAMRVVTERAATSIARYAGRLAQQRKQAGLSEGHVTIVTKENVLPQTDGVFRQAAERELSQVPGVTWDHLYVDEAARRLVSRPERFDVILTTNLFGDVLSDVAAEVMGGMPMAPSASIGDRHAYFEPVHGAGPDIAGKGIANPAGAILSAAMMLHYLGLPELGARMAQAVLDLISEGCCTPDLGGDSSTASFTDEVCAHLGR